MTRAVNPGPAHDDPEYAGTISINVTFDEMRQLSDAAGATGFDPHDGMLWSVVRERALHPWERPEYPVSKVALALLHDFTDQETTPCSHDHHGYCQEHGGNHEHGCPVARARDLFANLEALES